MLGLTGKVAEFHVIELVRKCFSLQLLMEIGDIDLLVVNPRITIGQGDIDMTDAEVQTFTKSLKELTEVLELFVASMGFETIDNDSPLGDSLDDLGSRLLNVLKIVNSKIDKDRIIQRPIHRRENFGFYG